jgi:seryl-tRNA synthetase
MHPKLTGIVRYHGSKIFDQLGRHRKTRTSCHNGMRAFLLYLQKGDECDVLDIKFIRTNADLLQTIAKQKGVNVSIQELLISDEKRRDLVKQTEQIRQMKNQLSKNISHMIRQNDTDEIIKSKKHVVELNGRLSILENDLKKVEKEFNNMMLIVPNIVSPDTPVGLSDLENVEIRRVGTPRTFQFECKDHVVLGEILDIIDIPRGVKVAGTRNYFLKGPGLKLHRAVQQLAIDLLEEQGFILMDVPLMVRKEALTNTGFFPLGQDQTFELYNEDKWLIGTSEVSLVSYYSNEIIEINEPIKMAAVSSCFRNEIGSAGKDVRGLYRVHQFSKVEQVVLCQNDPQLSEQILQEITASAEKLLQLLELPYRVVAVCTGDMSQKTYKQYDIETWMPSRNSYGETHSSSNLLDFQARRSNIRYRDMKGDLHFCHTLNNTAVASPRILIPLLENHQLEDGSIYIPEALRKYMNGAKEIKPPR